jgi:hypothetical protein
MLSVVLCAVLNPLLLGKLCPPHFCYQWFMLVTFSLNIIISNGCRTVCCCLRQEVDRPVPSFPHDDWRSRTEVGEMDIPPFTSRDLPLRPPHHTARGPMVNHISVHLSFCKVRTLIVLILFHDKFSEQAFAQKSNFLHFFSFLLRRCISFYFCVYIRKVKTSTHFCAQG